MAPVLPSRRKVDEGAGGATGPRVAGAGPAGALQPAAIQRFINEFQSIGSNGCLLLLAGGMTNPNKKSGQKQRDTQHRAARIGWQSARSMPIQ